MLFLIIIITIIIYIANASIVFFFVDEVADFAVSASSAYPVALR